LFVKLIASLLRLKSKTVEKILEFLNYVDASDDKSTDIIIFSDNDGLTGLRKM